MQGQPKREVSPQKQSKVFLGKLTQDGVGIECGGMNPGYGMMRAACSEEGK